MGIFSKKKETKLSEFCSYYYEQVFFQKQIVDQGVEDYFTHLSSGLEKLDNCFQGIDQDSFNKQLLALQFEVFSLAWMHTFIESKAVKLSEFTKNFLFAKGMGFLWEAMGLYNNAISIANVNTQTENHRSIWLKQKLDICDKFIAEYQQEGKEIDDTLRVLNLLYSEYPWKSGNTAYYLMLCFCHQLGLGSGPEYFGPNNEAQSALTVWIRGHYDGAHRAMVNIKLIE